MRGELLSYQGQPSQYLSSGVVVDGEGGRDGQ